MTIHFCCTVLFELSNTRKKIFSKKTSISSFMYSFSWAINAKKIDIDKRKIFGMGETPLDKMEMHKSRRAAKSSKLPQRRVSDFSFKLAALAVILRTLLCS